MPGRFRKLGDPSHKRSADSSYKYLHNKLFPKIFKRIDARVNSNTKVIIKASMTLVSRVSLIINTKIAKYQIELIKTAIFANDKPSCVNALLSDVSKNGITTATTMAEQP